MTCGYGCRHTIQPDGSCGCEDLYRSEGKDGPWLVTYCKPCGVVHSAQHRPTDEVERILVIPTSSLTALAADWQESVLAIDSLREKALRTDDTIGAVVHRESADTLRAAIRDLRTLLDQADSTQGHRSNNP